MGGKSREILKKVSTECVDGLLSNGLNAKFPDGGFYCFVDFKNTKKGFELSEKMEGKDDHHQRLIKDNFFEHVLRESGVAVLGGHHFGTMARSLFFRLSFVDFDGAEALKNPNNDKIFDKMKYGIDAIGKYMNS